MNLGARGSCAFLFQEMSRDLSAVHAASLQDLAELRVCESQAFAVLRTESGDIKTNFDKADLRLCTECMGLLGKMGLEDNEARRKEVASELVAVARGLPQVLAASALEVATAIGDFAEILAPGLKMLGEEEVAKTLAEHAKLRAATVRVESHGGTVQFMVADNCQENTLCRRQGPSAPESLPDIDTGRLTRASRRVEGAMFGGFSLKRRSLRWESQKVLVQWLE